jgi:hypothetical protein
MVKSKVKAEIPKKSKIKRFRGIKSGINSKNNKNLNKRKESKPFDKNIIITAQNSSFLTMKKIGTEV